MKNWRIFLGIVVGVFLAISPVASALNITVPSAPGSNYYLISTSTGAYVTTPSRPRLAQWVGTYSTSTNTFSDDFFFVDSTATIDYFYCKQQVLGDTLTLNFYSASSSMPAATSTGGYPAFSADQIITNTTSTKFIPDASTTIPLGGFLRIYAYNASSTELTCTTFFDE